MIAGKTDLLADTLDRTGVGRVLRAAGSWRGLVVLNYHRIGFRDRSPLDRGVFSATADAFDTQVRWLKSYCDLIGVEDLETALGDRSARSVMLTFDDGYRDNHELAFPILRRHEVPATFFITSGFLDERRAAWWDEIAWMVRGSPRPYIPANDWTGEAVFLGPAHCDAAIQRLLSVYKQLPGDRTDEFLGFVADQTGSGRCPPDVGNDVWMTWDMVRELHRGGMSIGGHTVTHPVLSRHDRNRQQREIDGCKSRIESELGAAVSAFSYPVGQPDSFDATTRDCLRQAGFCWAFSFHGGRARPGQLDPLNLPRNAVEPGLSPARFRALVTLPQLFARH